MGQRLTPDKIDFKYNLKEYFSFLKNYKWPLAVILFLVFLVEASFTLDKFLFKVIIDRGTEFVAGTLPLDGFVGILIAIAVAYLSVILLRPVGRWLHFTVLNKLETDLMFDLKRKYFNHIMHLSHDFHASHKTGSLISRLLRGGGAVETMTDVLVFNFAPLIFQVIVVGTALLLLSWVPALVLLLTIAVFLGYNLVMQNWQMPANVAVNTQEDVEKGNVADIFTNIDSIKYFGKEDLIKKRYKKIADKTRAKYLYHWNFYRWLDAGQTFILGVGVFFLILFPMLDFLKGALTLGGLTFIYTVYGNLMGPLFGFVHGIRNYYRAMADFESLFYYGKIKNEVKDAPDAKDLKIAKGAIEFKDLTFKYQKRKLFSKFNLKIAADEKVALVGPSGCGKSSLVKLLYRLYDVERGGILIDGRPTTEFRQESLRSELSIVPQECVLFDDSIYNNIRFSNPNATRKQVLKAMKFAQLDKIVKYFPQKENTIVGERGVKLSGGEKQRVSIARAILADRKVLVLDEATSALDSETEHEIQRDLEKLMRGRTSIIIAHRLSTIMHADKIVVMEMGKIVQMGTHSQLIKQKGMYKKLWNLQKGGYIK